MVVVIGNDGLDMELLMAGRSSCSIVMLTLIIELICSLNFGARQVPGVKEIAGIIVAEVTNQKWLDLEVIKEN